MKRVVRPVHEDALLLTVGVEVEVGSKSGVRRTDASGEEGFQSGNSGVEDVTGLLELTV